MSRTGYKTISVTDAVYNRLIKNMGIETAQDNRRVSLTEVIERGLEQLEARREFVFIAPGKGSS